MEDLVKGSDERMRCGWCAGDLLYTAYHDEEWGRLVLDDQTQFEFTVLESAQAGLSWITILKKREAYREAYSGFNPEEIASWGEKDVRRLMENPGIVRNRRKIESSITNARIFLEISERCGSFADWLLSFYGGRPRINRWERLEEIPAQTHESEALARELKKLGFRFFGPVIAYAHLQATGIVNDHLLGCWRYGESESK